MNKQLIIHPTIKYPTKCIHCGLDIHNKYEIYYMKYCYTPPDAWHYLSYNTEYVYYTCPLLSEIQSNKNRGRFLQITIGVIKITNGSKYIPFIEHSF